MATAIDNTPASISTKAVQKLAQLIKSLVDSKEVNVENQMTAISEALNELNARVSGLETPDYLPDLVGNSIDTQEIPRVGGCSVILTGSGAPAVNTDFIGQVYIDTTNAKFYFAKAVGNSTNWVMPYVKASSGIPSTDLASGVQTSLGKADSALQSSNIVTSWSSTTSDSKIPSEKLVKDTVDTLNNAIASIGSYEVVSLTTGANPHPDVASPSTKVIYLTKDSSSTATDPYTEWIWIDGTPGTWEVIGETSIALPDASTSEKGIVQLEDSHTSTSTTKAATPKNVKEAYDLADSKYSLPSGGIPKTDLASGVQSSLDDADSALQPSDIVTEWSSTTSDSKVPSEKLTKDSLDAKLNISSVDDVPTKNSSNYVKSSGIYDNEQVLVQALNEIYQNIKSLEEKRDKFDNVDTNTIHTMEVPFVGTSKIISYGSGAPTSKPEFIGQLYVDITNKKFYFAKGIGNSEEWSSSYSLPTDGIPKTDLASGVQSSLDKADSAIKGVIVDYTQLTPDSDGAVTIPNASRTVVGVVQLDDSHTSTSTTTAATPNAVKEAYDLANSKYTFPTGGIPKSDLASGVQSSLDKADSAIKGVIVDYTQLTPDSDGAVTIPNASRTVVGVVQLDDSHTSTSTTTAATPNAVKEAYDLANSKYTFPTGGIPKSDLASGVQSSLDKADGSFQSADVVTGWSSTTSNSKVPSEKLVNDTFQLKQSALPIDDSDPQDVIFNIRVAGARSADAAATANTAGSLVASVNAGNQITPVYFLNGTPQGCEMYSKVISVSDIGVEGISNYDTGDTPITADYILNNASADSAGRTLNIQRLILNRAYRVMMPGGSYTGALDLCNGNGNTFNIYNGGTFRNNLVRERINGGTHGSSYTSYLIRTDTNTVWLVWGY